MVLAVDIGFRSQIAAWFLEKIVRSNLPIGLGLDTLPTSPNLRNQDPWIKGFNLAYYPGEICEKFHFRVTNVGFTVRDNAAGNYPARVAQRRKTSPRFTIISPLVFYINNDC